jgi:phage host-nuclease inhibitor protein Gam
MKVYTLDTQELEDAAPEGFSIQGPDTLNWALGVLSEVEADIACIKAQVEEARRRIDARAAELTDKAERRGQYLHALVEQYASTHRSDIVRGKKKTLEVLNGSVGFRSKPGKLVVQDKQALESWLLSQDDLTLYRTSIAPEMDLLKRAAREHGVVPPGCEWVPESESIVIKPAAPTLTAAPSAPALEE